jgi:hypothetical protein
MMRIMKLNMKFTMIDKMGNNCWLIISKSKMASRVSERIEKAQAILSFEVNNERDLENLKEHYRSWTYYNQELIRNAFNSNENVYFKDYQKARRLKNIIQFQTESEPLIEKESRIKEKTKKELAYLENLLSILPIIKTSKFEVPNFDGGEDIKAAIIEDITQDRLLLALDKMQKVNSENIYRNEIRLLMSNINATNRSYNQGMINREEFFLEMAKSRKAVLQLVEEVF